MKQTKIIATIWPASEDKETLKKLYDAWANIARINCSHFEEEEFLRKVNNIKELNKIWETNFSILLDTKGPEIRTTMMDTPLEIKASDKVIVTIPEFADRFEKRLVSDYEYTIKDEEVGNLIDIDCGLLSLKILEKNDDHLVCHAYHSLKVKSRRHINLPWITLKFPGLTDFDKTHIAFWVKHWIDFVAMSFVRDKAHIEEYFEYLKEIKALKIPVIAKIETLDAVEKIDEIISVSDGVMVARWDLWAQVPMEALPSVQSDIVAKCKTEWKIVVVATNMLESMIDNPTPTRAELTDIYLAVRQKADATMLSGESAIWKFPVESVEMMAKTISYTEKWFQNKHNYFERNLWDDENKKQVIKSALNLADRTGVKAIVVFTNTGFMAKTTAALRPNQKVFAFTFSDNTIKKLNLCYWIKPVLIEKAENASELEKACVYMKSNSKLKKWDNVIVLIDGNTYDSDAPEMKMIRL